MMKIIPILIIPLFFLIVYLGVENLTQNNLKNDAKDKKINKISNQENKNIQENRIPKLEESELKIKAN